MKKIIFATILLAAAVCMTGCKYTEENVIRMPSRAETIANIEDHDLKSDAIKSHEFIAESTRYMNLRQAKNWCWDLAEYRCSMLGVNLWTDLYRDIVFYYTMLLNEVYDIRGIDKDCYFAEGIVTCLGFDAYPMLTRSGLQKKPLVIEENGDGSKHYWLPSKIAKRARLMITYQSSD